jgi:hypothetical protein
MPKSEDTKTELATTSRPPTTTPPSRLNIYFVSSLVTGVSTTLIMNPYDRGLYLSIKHERPFLLAANFTSPYQGAGQALFQRTVFGSMYYIMQGELKTHMYPVVNEYVAHAKFLAPFSEPLAHLSIGLTAGIAYGTVTNFMSAIKYYTWGDDNRSFFKSASEMLKNGGIEPFLKGTTATLSREVAYGSTYEVLRHLLKKRFVPENNKAQRKSFNLFDAEFICNVLAACVGAAVSSPWNFARSIQYGTKAHEHAPTIRAILKNFLHESKAHTGVGFGRVGFFVNTLKIGWGTLGTGIRMGIGQLAFDTMEHYFIPKDETTTKLKK